MSLCFSKSLYTYYKNALKCKQTVQQIRQNTNFRIENCSRLKQLHICSFVLIQRQNIKDILASYLILNHCYLDCLVS